MKNVNVKLNEIDYTKVSDMANKMNEDIESFILRAIKTQLYIDEIVNEKDIYPVHDSYAYNIPASSFMKMKNVLDDKSIDFEIVEKNRENVKIKTNVQPSDFEYLLSLKDKHSMMLKMPAKEFSDAKANQLMKMFHATAFTY